MGRDLGGGVWDCAPISDAASSTIPILYIFLAISLIILGVAETVPIMPSMARRWKRDLSISVAVGVCIDTPSTGALGMIACYQGVFEVAQAHSLCLIHQCIHSVR